MAIPETLVMVVLAAIAAYVACFKLKADAQEPYIAWLPSLEDELEDPIALTRSSR